MSLQGFSFPCLAALLQAAALLIKARRLPGSLNDVPAASVGVVPTPERRRAIRKCVRYSAVYATSALSSPLH